MLNLEKVYLRIVTFKKWKVKEARLVHMELLISSYFTVKSHTETYPLTCM